MNSADQPHAVMSADHTDLTDREDHSGRAWTAPSQGPAAPAGPPDSVTGPVVPTATASGTHLPLPLPADTPITAIAIPYFQWDNRDGG